MFVFDNDSVSKYHMKIECSTYMYTQVYNLELRKYCGRSNCTTGFNFLGTY